MSLKEVKILQRQVNESNKRNVETLLREDKLKSEINALNTKEDADMEVIAILEADLTLAVDGLEMLKGSFKVSHLDMGGESKNKYMIIHPATPTTFYREIIDLLKKLKPKEAGDGSDKVS